jgi:hypothetical protein
MGTRRTRRLLGVPVVLRVPRSFLELFYRQGVPRARESEPRHSHTFFTRIGMKFSSFHSSTFCCRHYIRRIASSFCDRFFSNVPVLYLLYSYTATRTNANGHCRLDDLAAGAWLAAKAIGMFPSALGQPANVHVVGSLDLHPPWIHSSN